MVQWLRFRASNAGGVGLVLGWGTKIPHAVAMHKKNDVSGNRQWFFCVYLNYFVFKSYPYYCI